MIEFRPAENLTVSCQGGGRGEIEIHSIGPGAAAWAWSVEFWREYQDCLLDQSEKWGIDTLYIAIPVRGGRVRHPEPLSAFLSKAGRRGISVRAVDGDPRATNPKEVRRYVRRVGAYQRFNAEHGPSAKIAGVQLDIEPYTLPTYQSDPQASDRAWAATVKSIATASDLPVEMAIPYWFAMGSHRTLALDPIAAVIENIVVMAYKNEASGAADAAEPAMKWGAVNRLPVRVAVEWGVSPGVERRSFGEAESGEVWLVSLAGRQVVVMLDHSRPNRLGRSFRLLVREMFKRPAEEVDADNEAFRIAADIIQMRFIHRREFKGVAFHGLFETADGQPRREGCAH